MLRIFTIVVLVGFTALCAAWNAPQWNYRDNGLNLIQMSHKEQDKFWSSPDAKIPFLLQYNGGQAFRRDK